MSIGPLGTNFSEILITIQNFLFTKMLLKIPSAKWRPSCPEGEESTDSIKSGDACVLLVNWTVIGLGNG